MFRTIIILCCLFTSVNSVAQSDLQLTFEADDFVGGMPVNQNGVIRFTVTNNGADDFFPSSRPIQIRGLYNYINSNGNPYRYFSNFNSSDADCLLTVEHIDPPPPVNNYGLFMLGTIQKSIAAQSTVICEFIVSIQEVALLDMQWQIAHIDDPNIDNNSQLFTFRGLAASVPANNHFMLLLLVAVLLISAWRYSLPKQT